MIDFTNFQQVFQWIVSHGYPLMFLIMCIEGPTATAAAAFASVMGFFNPFVVFGLSIMGDLVPDVLYYVAGRFAGMPAVRKIGNKFGMSDKRISGLEKYILLHGGRSVAVLKYTPVMATPGLMLVGATKMDWRKFIWFASIVTFQKTVTFMLLGYFFGQAYNIGKYIKYGSLIPIVIIVGYVLAAFAYKRFSERMVKKAGKL